MIPRNLSRHIVLAGFLGVLAFGLSIPAQTENALATRTAIQGMTKGYCASDPGAPVVYFSGIFDAVTKARNKIDTAPLNSAFKNYLVEEYDFKSSSNLPANCGLFETLSQADANRRQLISQAQQARKQVVEVNWNPSPVVETPQGDDSVTIGPKGPPPTHTFCALGHGSTMYFSAVFDTPGALINPRWNDSFNEFLRKNYSAEGEAQCTIMNTVREAEFNLKARVGGVRANNHKAVETGWRYNASLAAAKPAPKPTPKPDDDPEPPPRPAAPAPTDQTKDLAVKELPVSLAYCQNTPSLNGVFICDCFRRLVYSYRMDHPTGPPEPLASLVAGEKLAWSECLDNLKIGRWVSDRATAQKLTQRVINCVTQKFIVGFYAQPKLNSMNGLYNESVAACNK
jgi:hypothetical protein